MLQSKGAAPKGEARAATQAFVTEPVTAVTIVVGEAKHKNARRVHDATLVGLAPPPPVHFSSTHHQPMALPEQQTLRAPRDDRGLATMLVVGTLIAMFAIAFSALPERDPVSPPEAKAAKAKSVAAAPPVQAEVKAEPAPPSPVALAVPSTPAPEAPALSEATPAPEVSRAERAPVKATKAPVARVTSPRGKIGAKADTKAAARRRLAKPASN